MDCGVTVPPCKRSQKISHFMDCTLLIECVKKRPSLYNTKLRSSKSKIELWGEVADIMNRNVLECRIAWGSLRSSYARHLQNVRKHQEGILGKPFKPWYLANEFGFLNEHMKLSSNERRLYFKNPNTTSDTNGTTPTTVFNMIPYKSETLSNGDRLSIGSKQSEDISSQEDYIEILDDSLDGYDFEINQTENKPDHVACFPTNRFPPQEFSDSNSPLQHNQSYSEYPSFHLPEQFSTPQSNSTLRNPESNLNLPVSTPTNNKESFKNTHANESSMFEAPKQTTMSNFQPRLIAQPTITDPRERSTMSFFESIVFDTRRLTDRQLRMFKQDILRDLNKYLDEDQ